MQLSIVVPTFNEAPNIAELVRRVTAAVDGAGIETEILFVDDSTDVTPDVIREVAARSQAERRPGEAPLPVRLIHRDIPSGGLGGAVLEGIAAAESDACLVMDGDLQHPPEDIPALWERCAHSRRPVDAYPTTSPLPGMATSMRHNSPIPR